MSYGSVHSKSYWYKDRRRSGSRICGEAESHRDGDAGPVLLCRLFALRGYGFVCSFAFSGDEHLAVRDRLGGLRHFVVAPL